MIRPRLAQGRAAWPCRGLAGSVRRRLGHSPGVPGLTSLLTHPFVNRVYLLMWVRQGFLMTEHRVGTIMKVVNIGNHNVILLY